MKKTESKLMNVKEFCEYLNIGQTKGRQLLLRPDSTFTIRIGNRLYAHKDKLELYLERCADTGMYF